jgi:intracellular sulfur oxidation DsrE/DsrF family protein
MPDRRQFLGTLAAASAASLAAPSMLSASSPSLLDASPDKWDLTWLDVVKAKSHKQVFDMGLLDMNGISPLHFPFFWLNAHNEVYPGMTDAKLAAVVGIAGNAFPMNFTDAIWAKYPLGDTWKVMDPATKAASKRNVFTTSTDAMASQWTIPALQQRGVIFWMCNNALTLITGMMADGSKQQHDVVYAEFKAGLLPGVKLVPSHTMMLTASQEHGCTYQRV